MFVFNRRVINSGVFFFVCVRVTSLLNKKFFTLDFSANTRKSAFFFFSKTKKKAKNKTHTTHTHTNIFFLSNIFKWSHFRRLHHHHQQQQQEQRPWQAFPAKRSRAGAGPAAFLRPSKKGVLTCGGGTGRWSMTCPRLCCSGGCLRWSQWDSLPSASCRSRASTLSPTRTASSSSTSLWASFRQRSNLRTAPSQLPWRLMMSIDLL